ncbi:hypothetical protein [Pseudonocardia sp. GCM10023141]|uniref:hypothetical protein n=1 Tax=Pseudonocardia sp. GCM10023141 TaxID=3252653 RepID=UPI00361891FC
MGDRDRGPAIEIACDESGSEGEKLIGATTDVFAHASVGFDLPTATRCMQEIRRRAPTPAQLYKANHILREKNRAALEWMLGAGGPLAGHTRVYLADKAFLVVGKVVDLLLDGPGGSAWIGLRQSPHARSMTLTLYREGRRVFAREPWEAFLLASNNLMRLRNRRGMRTSVDSFFRMVEILRSTDPPSAVDEVLALLQGTRRHADAFRESLVDEPVALSALDPLIPALVSAVEAWGQGITPVSIVHDRQTTLSEQRIAQLAGLFTDPAPGLLGYVPHGRLAGLRLVASQADPRLQIADVLAGAVRKAASDELNGRGDPVLTALLRPFVDTASIWGDDRSWALLGPVSPIGS